MLRSDSERAEAWKRFESVRGISSKPNEWPLWAKMAKLLAKPEDKGIGDVIHHLIGPENSEAFKSWFKNTFGKDCGCAGRQAEWNRLYPLTPNQ